MTGLVLSVVALACSLLALIIESRLRAPAKKGLILAHLIKNGESTGRQLRDAGVGGLVYNYLLELEQEGLIESRLHPGDMCSTEFGRIARRLYKLKGTGE